MQRARAATTGNKEAQLRPPPQPRPGHLQRGGPEFESPHPAAASPSGLLPTRRSVTEDGPHPPHELGAVAATCERSSFSSAVPPACHKQRSQGGIWRSVTVTPRRPMGWARASNLRWGRARNCMACKRSCRIGWLASLPSATRQWSGRWPKPQGGRGRLHRLVDHRQQLGRQRA
jgi:hypothetical protein